MGPHVAILIAWGKLPSRAHEVADRKWWPSAWRAAKIREVQGHTEAASGRFAWSALAPWRRFQGPPEALGRVQGGAPANRFQERRSLQGAKMKPLARTRNANLPPTVARRDKTPRLRSGHRPAGRRPAPRTGPRRLGEPMTESVKQEAWANRAGRGPSSRGASAAGSGARPRRGWARSARRCPGRYWKRLAVRRRRGCPRPGSS